MFYHVTRVTILVDKTAVRNATKFRLKCTNTTNNATTSARKSATKSTQQLCCTFDKAICVYQVSEISLLIA